MLETMKQSNKGNAGVGNLAAGNLSESSLGNNALDNLSSLIYHTVMPLACH